MIFPTVGGADDANSIFVVVQNKTNRRLRHGQEVVFPQEIDLKDDRRHIKECRVRLDMEVDPGKFVYAKLLSAEFWAN